jgi:hypothetical protein
LKPFDFVEGAPLDVAHSNLEPLTLLQFSLTAEFSDFFKNGILSFFQIFK